MAIKPLFDREGIVVILGLEERIIDTASSGGWGFWKAVVGSLALMCWRQGARDQRQAMILAGWRPPASVGQLPSCNNAPGDKSPG